MYPTRSSRALQRFFAGFAEYTFQTRLGVADPPLIEYVSALLARFVHRDAIYGVRDLAGRRLDEIAQMLVEAQCRAGDARREVHRHIGDFALFWSGVYPEALRQPSRHSPSADRLLDYWEQGKRSYYIASTMQTDENREECKVLERLSHEFELVVYGLSEARREWERQDPSTGSGLLID